MNSDPRSPPHLFSRLLGRSLPHPNADEVLGDLHEEFLQMSETRGGTRARWWYAGESLRLVREMLIEQRARADGGSRCARGGVGRRPPDPRQPAGRSS